MEKRDLLAVGISIVVVLVLALVVKPALQEGGISLLSGESTISPEATVPTPKATPIVGPPTPPPTQVPVWDGTVQSVAFVNPATYQINMTETQPTADIPFQQPPQKYDLTVFATINGKWSGTTEIITIPFPYWEMHYTVSELTEPGYVYPSINIQVMDVSDPNRFVRIINPGVLDSRAWSEYDPRPWVEKFYEGERSYYFVITTRFVESYAIDIMVPSRYLAS
ncbi:MAG: hypothetical protein GKC04_04700 [Methanomicrobiales archaeon]|nr:hypothetical protein [Methanomicrobiales archaeon]